MPETMRAVVCRDWGGPETLELDEGPVPAPGPGEVLIEVHAAGVNFADTLIIRGTYQERPPRPFSPGFEVGGTVAAVGPGVDGLEPGTRVLAVVGWGGYATHAVARATDVFAIPPEMDFVTAAGFPVTYGTAHGALKWRADLEPGETLLVHGAAGGVGLAAVEVGKAMGARVIATAGGPDKLAVARDHGADRGIDYKTEDVRARIKALTDGRGADVVFDPVGGDVFDATLRAVAWSGRIVVVGFAAGRVPQVPANILLVKNCTVLGFYWGSYRSRAPQLLEDQFRTLFAWFTEGRLRPHVSHTLDLADAARAMQLLLERRSTGKVVLTTGRAARAGV
jgi:NADPH2:quinone reductase